MIYLNVGESLLKILQYLHLHDLNKIIIIIHKTYPSLLITTNTRMSNDVLPI
jgi:hypothetical protein